MDDIVHSAVVHGWQEYGYGNLIGSEITPDSALDSLWSQLAAHYAFRASPSSAR